MLWSSNERADCWPQIIHVDEASQLRLVPSSLRAGYTGAQNRAVLLHCIFVQSTMCAAPTNKCANTVAALWELVVFLKSARVRFGIVIKKDGHFSVGSHYLFCVVSACMQLTKSIAETIVHQLSLDLLDSTCFMLVGLTSFNKKNLNLESFRSTKHPMQPTQDYNQPQGALRDKVKLSTFPCESATRVAPPSESSTKAN